jgi:hypothetical protein
MLNAEKITNARVNHKASAIKISKIENNLPTTFASDAVFSAAFTVPRTEVISQCHSEERSDEASAFMFCSFRTPTPIRHEYGEKQILR